MWTLGNTRSKHDHRFRLLDVYIYVSPSTSAISLCRLRIIQSYIVYNFPTSLYTLRYAIQSFIKYVLWMLTFHYWSSHTMNQRIINYDLEYSFSISFSENQLNTFRKKGFSMNSIFRDICLDTIPTGVSKIISSDGIFDTTLFLSLSQNQYCPLKKIEQLFHLSSSS